MSWELLEQMGLWSSIKDINQRKQHLQKVARNIRKHRRMIGKVCISNVDNLSPQEREEEAENEVRQLAQFGHFTVMRTGMNLETGDPVEYAYEYEQHTDGHVMVWREEICQ